MRGPTVRLAREKLVSSLTRFRDDERGALAIFMVFAFLLMIMFGGIAVDVMRFETRRVALQQTMDRAALAAASLRQTEDPRVIAEEWFTKAGLSEDLAMVEFSTPEVSTIADAGLRRVTIEADVRSYNFFMQMMDIDFLQGPSVSEAAQGVSQIEVMLVLDITGSMGSSLGDGKTKIQGLREAAREFVEIVKENDRRNGVSIGMVPYAAQVNFSDALRDQFNAINISSWDGVANAGVPYINCFEIPTSTYGTTGLSLTSPIRMAAVADANSTVPNTSNYLSPNSYGPVPTSRACTTIADNPSTGHNESTNNHIVLPSKDTTNLLAAIGRLQAAGNTSIAVGMRWGTALIDQAARPIYTAIGDATVQGRPVDNDSITTRKIIILMTDGEHVTNTHVRDNYKSGPSPIWRASDGSYAMRFWSDGTDLNDNSRPSCAGSRTYFVPSLKRNWVDLNGNGTNDSGETGACDSRAWVSDPTWQRVDSNGNLMFNNFGQPLMVTGTRLDWSEVWRYLRVSYVARQFYMRSNVSGTSGYSTVMNLMRTTYLSSVANMNSLLQQNCAAARAAGIEIYGIAFAAPANGQSQINGCASFPKENYYYTATDNDRLLAAFRQIATDISDLRLTQ